MISAVLFSQCHRRHKQQDSQQGNSLTVQLNSIRTKDLVRLASGSQRQDYPCPGYRRAKFPQQAESLIIVPQESKAKYQVEEQGDNLVITTSAMRAVLNEATGHIAFYDLKAMCS